VGEGLGARWGAGYLVTRQLGLRLAAVLLILAVVFSATLASSDEKVAFNVQTKKYHCLSCRCAIACTKNCIEIQLSEAKRRGGIACKVCGGRCK
jgi:hypothetical protein